MTGEMLGRREKGIRSKLLCKGVRVSRRLTLERSLAVPTGATAADMRTALVREAQVGVTRLRALVRGRWGTKAVATLRPVAATASASRTAVMTPTHHRHIGAKGRGSGEQRGTRRAREGEKWDRGPDPPRLAAAILAQRHHMSVHHMQWWAQWKEQPRRAQGARIAEMHVAESSTLGGPTFDPALTRPSLHTTRQHHFPR